jgi:hypothetical protein
MDEMPSSPESNSRREFVRKSAYLAPAILTLSAGSSVAKAGSAKVGNPKGQGPEEERGKPPRPPRGRRD